VGLTLVAAFAGVLRATVDRDLLPEGVFRITLRHPRSEASPNF
jgi:hypothetical protein